MSRDRFHHGDLRAALLAAGLAAVRSRGDLSLRALAREAGVTPTAAYRHFADKDALLRALAAEGYARLSSAMPGPDDPRPTRERIVAAGLAYIAFARAEPGLFRLMTGLPSQAASGPDAGHPGAAAFAAFADLVAGAMTGAGAADAHRTTLGLWAVAHGLADLLVSGQIPATDLPDTATQAILSAAVAGAIPP